MYPPASTPPRPGGGGPSVPQNCELIDTLFGGSPENRRSGIFELDRQAIETVDGSERREAFGDGLAVRRIACPRCDIAERLQHERLAELRARNAQMTRSID